MALFSFVRKVQGSTVIQYPIVAAAGWYPDPNGGAGLRFWDGSAWTQYVTNESIAPQLPPTGAITLPAAHLEPIASSDRPHARMIRSPLEAEEVAAEWLSWFGFVDIKATGAGADGGVDVRGKSLVAQVKMHMVPIGRPDLQRLYGAAQAENAVSAFFSLTDYTRDAKAWADQVGMALFRFSPAGEAEPTNEYASVLYQAAEHRSGSDAYAAHPTPARPPLYGLPVGCSDEAVCRILAPRRSGLRRIERMVWVRQGWLPCATLTYGYNYLHTDRKGLSQNLFSEVRRGLELVLGSAIRVPQSTGKMVLVDRAHINIRERHEPAELVSQVKDLWGHLWTVHQPAAVERDWGRLSRFGVPRDASTLRVSLDSQFVLPFFAALIENPAGRRIAVAEGATGTLHDGLSTAFTYNAPELKSELLAGRKVGDYED
jgi:hypothetical protein